MIGVKFSIKSFQLARLQHVLEQRQTADTAYTKKLCNLVIVSLYLACGKAGAGDAAHKLLARYVQ